MRTRPLLVELLSAMAIESRRSYSWLGQTVEIDHDVGPADDTSDALSRELRGRLYTDFYLTGGVAPVSRPLEPAAGPWPSETVAELSAANAGMGCRRGGWTVRAVDGDRVAVERAGLTVWAARDQLQATTDLTPGATVALAAPKESFGPPGGFYASFGDAGTGDEDGAGIDRFYWNVRPAGRSRLMHLLTTALNAVSMPFRFKVLSDPRAYRCDAGVLYTSALARRPAAAAVSRLHADMGSDLRPEVPAFTRRLAGGLGFAEDPPGDGSFGQHRCDLLAAALVGCHRDGVTETSERLAAVAAAFERDGIAPDAPHRNPGSGGEEPVLSSA